MVEQSPETLASEEKASTIRSLGGMRWGGGRGGEGGLDKT